MSSDPRDVIASSPMSRMQILIVAITIGLNALDGFDVLSISFASPGIAAEWGMDRARLGIVLSMELIGMALGSIVLGGVADRYGRRPTILGCLIVMVIGMFMAPAARGIADLSLWRVVTGVGIGGMLAAINAVAAEFSNTRRRYLSVSLMAIGYPLGVVIGGTIAARLLSSFDWRSVFYLGAALSAVFVPLVYWFVPESVHWLTRKQPEGALRRINDVLLRIGKSAVDTLPVISPEARRRTSTDIFSPALIVTTVIVTIAYFFHITTFYYIIKWAPKIIVDMGFPASSAAGVLVWANLGGALGGATFGLLTMRMGVKALTVGVIALSAVMVNLFGRSPADLQMLSLICAAACFCSNAGIIGMYAIFASAFPTHARAFGTGFTVGVGRGGAVLSPIIAGFLLNSGSSLPTVASIMALGSVIAAGVLVFLKFNQDANRGLN